MARRAFSNSNPALSDTAFERIAASEAGWAAGTEQKVHAELGIPTATRPKVMTVNGTIWATAALLVVVVIGGIYGWNQVDTTSTDPSLPGWIFPIMLVAFGVAMVTIFKPNLARFTAPIYALLEGAFLGAISGLYNEVWNGIAIQAVMLTIGVFAVMLFLYGTRIIKVTEKLRMGIVAATGAVLLVYVANMILTLFGANLPFLHDVGPSGHRHQPGDRRRGGLQPAPRLRLHRAGRRSRSAGQDGVVRRLRAARHHRVAVPRAPAPVGAAAGPRLTRPGGEPPATRR